LRVKAGVIFQSGDVRPVARTDFFLLPASLELLSAKAAVEHGINIESFDDYVEGLKGLSA
jgi:hypothetical protein